MTTAQRPWHIEYAAHMAGLAVVAADGKHVAYCVQELSEADATLLAAAPELLAKCEAALAVLDTLIRNDDIRPSADWPTCVAVRDNLRIAITAARAGESPKIASEHWEPFYFDGNQAWGLCSAPSEWERIKADYRKAAIRGSVTSPIGLLDSHRCPNTEPPKFGFRAVTYTGAQTLREFFAEHGMDPGEL